MLEGDSKASPGARPHRSGADCPGLKSFIRKLAGLSHPSLILDRVHLRGFVAITNGGCARGLRAAASVMRYFKLI